MNKVLTFLVCTQLPPAHTISAKQCIYCIFINEWGNPFLCIILKQFLNKQNHLFLQIKPSTHEMLFPLWLLCVFVCEYHKLGERELCGSLSTNEIPARMSVCLISKNAAKQMGEIPHAQSFRWVKCLIVQKLLKIERGSFSPRDDDWWMEPLFQPVVVNS